MTDSRIQELLEELMDSGRTPEELCQAHPELLNELRERWRRVRMLMGEADVIFPPASTQHDADIHGPVPTFRLGQTPALSGYDTLEVIGRGGMGVVYKARHQGLNRVVAIKMLLCGEHGTSTEFANLVKEAQSIAGLRHPNIVQVHDVGEFHDLPFFTMEFVEGGNLSQTLSGEPQPAMTSAEWISILARAVHAAHERGVVHRDLKPGNVLVSDDGTLKITDFGLARRFTGNDQTVVSVVARVGTLSYMPPEQALGTSAAIKPTADIYSLGAILYEMLTGRPPFRGESAAETERQIINDEPVPPHRLNPRTPRDLQTICLKCLQKSPARRYQSASELADDLDRFKKGEPIRARRVGRFERLLKWGQRKPTSVALLAAAVALLGLSLGGGAWLLQQHAERRAELRSDIGASVIQASNLRQKYHFSEARELLMQAAQRLRQAGPEDLRKHVERATADLELVETLDKARQRAAIIVGGRFDRAGAEPLYFEALAQSGLGWPNDESGVVATRVRRSPVRTEIIAALHDWASVTSDHTRQKWILAIAAEADPDTRDDRLHRPELWQGGPELPKLTQELRIEELSPQLLTALCRVMGRTEPASALPLLRAAQAKFPDDFWLNFELGSVLDQSGGSSEAIGFYRAALAIRPDSSSAHHSLAMNLLVMKRFDEAVSHFEKSLAIDSTFAVAHNNFGVALQAGGRLEDAIAQYEAAVRFDPDESAVALSNLGTVLLAQGRVDEALARFKESIRLDPKLALTHYYLGEVYGKKDQFHESIGHLEQSLQIDPKLIAGRKLISEQRFRAACAAVVASGEAEHESPPRKSEPQVLRLQALTWMRAELEFSIQIQSDSPTRRSESISAWRSEPALAGVRDAAALAKMDEAERVQWERLWADVATVCAADPTADGIAHAAQQNWADAVACYTRALEIRPTDDAHFWFEYAALNLLSGDDTGYAKACERMVDLCREGKNMRAYLVARVSTLAPNPGVETSLPARLAETELQRSAGQFWALTQRGALNYRAGRYPESAVLFEQSLRADARPGSAVINWLWLAMANHKLGKSEEAHRRLDMAVDWLNQFKPGLPSRGEAEFGLHLHNWLEAHILLREAETLIGPPASNEAKNPPPPR